MDDNSFKMETENSPVNGEQSVETQPETVQPEAYVPNVSEEITTEGTTQPVQTPYQPVQQPIPQASQPVQQPIQQASQPMQQPIPQMNQPAPQPATYQTPQSAAYQPEQPATYQTPQPAAYQPVQPAAYQPVQPAAYQPVYQTAQPEAQPVPPAQEYQNAPASVPYDAYIYRLNQEQQKPEPPKKKRFFGRFVALVLTAVLFGGIAGGVYIGIRHWDEKHSQKNEEEQSENEEIQSELSEKKKNSNGSIILATSDEIPEATVSAIDVSAVAESTMPSVVAINNYMKQAYSYFFYDGGDEQEVLAGSGSGIIIGQNENEVLLVTNFHVVDGAKRLSVTFVDGTSADAVVKGSASSSDLAVLAVKFEDLADTTIEAIRVARIGNSDNVKVGEIVIAVGNALGYGQSVTVGYISAKERDVTIDKVTHKLIQTDAAINPGNSGGALLNKNGEVIGINSAKYADYDVEGMGFAIPITNIISLIEELSNREELSESEMGYLGIDRGTDITDDYYAQRFNIPKGLYVNSVSKGSAAEKAGIVAGDIIVRVDNVIIYGMSDLQEFLSYTKAGTEVEVEVYRSNNGTYEEQILKVRLDSRPTKNQRGNSKH